MALLHACKNGKYSDLYLPLQFLQGQKTWIKRKCRECTGKKKTSIFSIASSSILQNYLLQRRWKWSRKDAVKSEQLRQSFRRRCLRFGLQNSLKIGLISESIVSEGNESYRYLTKLGKEHPGHAVIFILPFRSMNLGTPIFENQTHLIVFASSDLNMLFVQGAVSHIRSKGIVHAMCKVARTKGQDRYRRTAQKASFSGKHVPKMSSSCSQNSCED